MKAESKTGAYISGRPPLDKELVKLILSEGYSRRDKPFPREKKIVDVKKIYTVIGPRRAGKTYFLFQIIDALLAKGVRKEQVLYINFEDERLEGIQSTDLQTIISAFFELNPENRDKKVYFVFDEIQNAPSWPKFVRRLYDKENCEIYVTGSSAKLLSQEIATELRGRTWDYDIFPLSFREYLRGIGFDFKERDIYSKERFAIMKHFDRYLIAGGFPEIHGYDESIRCRILQNYFELVIIRDIIERHSLPYIDIVKEMSLYLAQNFSKPFSINKYYNILKSQNRKVSKDTLYSLSEYVQETMYFYLVPIYSNSKTVQMVNPKKIYIIDNGLAHCLSIKATKDLCWYFENLVFIELRRRGHSVYYHRDRYECDFIAVEANGKKLAIQVTLDETKEEELAGLLEGMAGARVDEGLILTRDTDKTLEIDGKTITCIPLWKWLLQ